MKKPRGDAKLKTLLPAGAQEELYQVLLRRTQAKAIAWLKEEHGVSTSAGALTHFFDWYREGLTRRMAADASSQLESTLKKLPELKLTADQASLVAQVNFELMAAQNHDVELYAMLGKASLEKQRLLLEREKFEESKKKDWEKGLAALQEEIKGNPVALEHFEAMKAALAKGAN
jgi:hypothetical protein